MEVAKNTETVNIVSEEIVFLSEQYNEKEMQMIRDSRFPTTLMGKQYYNKYISKYQIDADKLIKSQTRIFFKFGIKTYESKFALNLPIFMEAIEGEEYIIRIRIQIKMKRTCGV